MAMFSRTAEYALRAMVSLAVDEGDNTSHMVGQIAVETRVPAGYLSIGAGLWMPASELAAWAAVFVRCTSVWTTRRCSLRSNSARQ